MLEKATSPLVAGITLETLQANQGVQPYVAAAPLPFADGKVPTPSGRFEPYYEDMLKFGQAFPVYEAAEETGPDGALRKKYPLQLCQMRTRFHIHNQFCDATWIRQYMQTHLQMNPVDLAQRGLVDGDDVKVANDRGEFGCSVRANECIKPGSVRIYEGEWSKHMNFGNIQNVTNPGISDRGRALLSGPVIPYNDTLVEVKKA